MSEREAFCRLAGSPGANMRDLCRRFGISPTTGYKWQTRHAGAGPAGLADRSRRPRSSPGRTEAGTEAAVMAVRAEHPAWGGRKIRFVLQAAGLGPPSASTITAILRRHGALDGPGTGRTLGCQRFEYEAPNDLWQMDFKGHVALDHGRCHPLTVLDDHSRYALDVGACADERGTTVRARLEALFARYGLPRRMLADNGAPWGAPSSRDNHSTLSIWLMDLGVPLMHGAAYHPQTQGKEERFHRTLKAEALDGRPLRDLAHAQRRFDVFRTTYNTERPHEGIGMAVPASRYTMSPRSLPTTIAPPDYEPHATVRKVQAGGWLSWKGRDLRISTAFQGRAVVFRPTQTDGCFVLCYRSFKLAEIDLAANQPTVHHLPEHRPPCLRSEQG